MSKHMKNAVFGALDYASYPVAMLLVAPIVLHRLGASEYGLWMIATSVISAGGIIASGFSDANLQQVARLRGTPDAERILDAVRSILGINLALGVTMGVVVWGAAPWVAPRMAIGHGVAQEECLLCLRIAAISILFRALEAVGVSTLRAFEEYRTTVQISSCTRIVTLIVAAGLALLRQSTVSILICTAVFLLLDTVMQFRALRPLLGCVPVRPSFRRKETAVLLKNGFFTWIQASGGVVFGQLDRILLGVSMGAFAVAPYALCVQFAQPISGLSASGLHFLFPYFSSYGGGFSSARARAALLRAFLANLLLVCCGASALLVIGMRLIRSWGGPTVADAAGGIFPMIAWGAALMGLSVTGTYAMQGIGLFRTVAGVSLSSRAGLLILMPYLLHHLGIQGLAWSRLGYGAVALLIYVPLIGHVFESTRCGPHKELSPDRCAVKEGWEL